MKLCSEGETRGAERHPVGFTEVSSVTPYGVQTVAGSEKRKVLACLPDMDAEIERRYIDREEKSTKSTKPERRRRRRSEVEGRSEVEEMTLRSPEEGPGHGTWIASSFPSGYNPTSFASHAPSTTALSAPPWTCAA